MKKLSELINDQRNEDRRRFLNSPDKGINYYYQEREGRVKNGEEKYLVTNEEDESSK